ncbi:hypothetical protein [Kordiimonas sp. SCSIO 12610]|uniref:hypothetical protein n=1 Tax=Kordiimonas sp. SCSIO 12610 TaxID=2829597 RepID=UPI002109A7D8|nr:hypothetical protein [Kordiimonas sp. SCSIO 12610]UTW54863.1 hypothetical protein KFF44_13780 [Kordiimonas sp. SCSIO 12610]
MLERIRGYIFWVCGGVVLLGALGYIFALTGSGQSLFGSNDGTLEPTNFAQLTFSTNENGYLLCNKSTCPNANPNNIAARFLSNIRSIRLNLADYADNNPLVRLRSFDPTNNQFEFLERSPGRPYPAIVSIKLTEAPNQATDIAIYTYQPIGNSTPDDHKDRVEKWLRVLTNRLANFNN